MIQLMIKLFSCVGKLVTAESQMLVGNVNNSDNSISIASTTQIHSGSATRIGGTFDSSHWSCGIFL